MDSPLTYIVRDRLEPVLLAALSCITVELREGLTTARMSFALYGNSPTAQLLLHTISVSDEPLPTGVTGTYITRWPDALYELPPQPGAVEQIQDLAASGLVGRVNWHHFDLGAGLHHWLIKTRAGSQAERTAWLLALSARHKVGA